MVRPLAQLVGVFALRARRPRQRSLRWPHRLNDLTNLDFVGRGRLALRRR